MKLFSSKQVAEIDRYTVINEPIDSIDLMERAARKIAEWICAKLDNHFRFKIFVGPGNNGGDGLVIARHLVDLDYSIEVYLVKISDKLSPDAETNLKRLETKSKQSVFYIDKAAKMPVIEEFDVVLDALFGSGLSRPLKGLAADVVEHINASKAFVIAIDTPSGLFGEDNSGNSSKNIVKADVTLALQFPNISFMYPENYEFVGEIHTLPIGLHPDIINSLPTPFTYVDNNWVAERLQDRDKFAHKGNFGHVLLVAGSYGKMGAAVLSARACLRTGVGLLTLHIPQSGCQILQTSVPEAMISFDQDAYNFTSLPDLENFGYIGVGPGLGKHMKTKKVFSDLLENCERPMVIDADGLNIIAEKPSLLDKIPKNSILTPHPKEFERLFGSYSDSYSRNMAQIDYSVKYGVQIVLKGAHTCITTSDGQCFFNSTGNPGMATAGSGDVLTGMILSLLAQGYSAQDAAIIGVYLHGLSGDIATETESVESLIAGDIISNIGNAFRMIKEY